MLCPPGSGTVTCVSPSGLAPGASVELVFRLVADPNAQDGDITGTVTAGTAIAVRLTVRVTVASFDDLRLAASIDTTDSWWSWLWDESPILDVDVTNTGTSTKPVTVTVDRSGMPWSDRAFTCQGGHQEVTCVTDQALAPGHSQDLRVRLYHLRPVKDTVDVTGRLGSATASADVVFTPPRCDWLWCWPTLPGPPSGVSPTPLPSDTNQPSTTQTTPTRKAPPTTTTRHQPPPTIDLIPTTTPPAEPGSTPPTTTPPTTTTPTTTPPSGKPSCSNSPPSPGKIQPGAPTDCQPILPSLFSLLGPL